MANRNTLRLLVTVVASLALLAALSACGGGGSAPAAADPVPPVTVQPTVTSVTVTINDALGQNGSTVTVKAVGTNGADTSANLTASAVWTIVETGNGASGLKVSTAGLILNTDGTTHVVPVGKTVAVEATATVGATSKAATPKVVTGACSAGLTPFGATCKFVGKSALSSSLTTSWIVFRQIVAGKVVQTHTFDGKGLPVMKACVSSGASSSRVSCMLLDGKSSMTFDLYVDGTSAVVDSVYHAGEKEFADPTTLAGTLCDASARTSFQLGDACIANSKVNTFAWAATFVGGTTVDLEHLLSIADFN